MIFLTKLDRSRVLVTLANVKYVEVTPDTLLRFVNGDMLIVCETMEEISNLAEEFNARCLRRASLTSNDRPNPKHVSHESVTSQAI